MGVAGLSLGGALTAALTCLEPRFAFSAPSIGHMDLEAVLADVPVLEPVRRQLAGRRCRVDWRPAHSQRRTEAL